MLNASQNLTNLAAFSEALISITPAKSKGWFAIIPTVFPLILEKLVIMFKD